ncbi:hypothetical protein FB451DRAFT_716663 [Mycena latifolia]|nr:hypothetical protein FB451DRAFT_716663 [Mycena latifolia]
MSHDSIPQELVDLIVDNLQDDISTLKCCSLTARAFVSSSQRHMFRKIQITPPPLDNSQSSCQKLCKLLSSSPHVAPLVEDLIIVLVGSETSFDYDSDGEWLTKPHTTWIMTGRTLSLVLPLLNPRRISLVENAPPEWNSGGEFSMNWNKLGRTLKSALSDTFSSPRLESVHLRGIVVESPRQLLSLFSEASALRDMSLSRIYFTQRWDQLDPWPESQPWRPQLQSLLISDAFGDTFCRYLLNPRIDLTRVTSLTLVTDSAAWRGTGIQTTKSSSVEHLRLRDLQHIPLTIESIASMLGANLRSVHFFSLSTFRLMHTFFMARSDANRLETVTFEGPMDPSLPLNWRSLNETIDSSVTHFRSLKMVELKAYRITYPHNPLELWAQAVKTLLSSLVARDMLTVTEIHMTEDEVEPGWE